MQESIIEKYFKNFKVILPYIIVKIIFSYFVVFLLIGGMTLKGAFNIFTSGINFEEIKSAGTFIIIVSFILIIFVEPFFQLFITMIMKKIEKKEVIKQMETLKACISYYLRFLGVNILIGLMIFGLYIFMLLMAVIPVIGILAMIGIFIFLVYVVTIYSCSTEYLVYSDCEVGEALSYGKEVGKKFFWSLLIVNIIFGVINLILGKVLEYNSSIILAMVFSLIMLVIESMIILYRMSLCKEYEGD